MISKIVCKQDLIELLEIYKKFDYEVGGMLFGSKFLSKYTIKTLSFKKGKNIEISFFSKDKIIYIKPEKQILLGTWHLHPMQANVAPSSIDLHQWNSWNKSYIHIICGKKDFKIFNSRGDCIYEYVF